MEQLHSESVELQIPRCQRYVRLLNHLCRGEEDTDKFGLMYRPTGAIYSVLSFLACVAPRMTFQLYGIIPIPAWACVSGIFLWDSYQSLHSSVSIQPAIYYFHSFLEGTNDFFVFEMRNEQGGKTDTAGHVGGLLAGAIAFLKLRFRI